MKTTYELDLEKQIKGLNVCMWLMTVFTVACIGITFYFGIAYGKLANENNAIIERNRELEAIMQPVREQPTVSLNYDTKAYRDEVQEVIFTNYYVGDKYGTTDITASEKKIEDFEVNEDGFYTYNGLVVVGTANLTRYDKPLRYSYITHELYDKLEITLNDKVYQAIVLDVCGACYGVEGETKQRIDVFTTSDVIGKKDGLKQTTEYAHEGEGL